jgi:hypothetical protein
MLQYLFSLIYIINLAINFSIFRLDSLLDEMRILKMKFYEIVCLRVAIEILQIVSFGCGCRAETLPASSNS